MIKMKNNYNGSNDSAITISGSEEVNITQYITDKTEEYPPLRIILFYRAIHELPVSKVSETLMRQKQRLLENHEVLEHLVQKDPELERELSQRNQLLRTLYIPLVALDDVENKDVSLGKYFQQDPELCLDTLRYAMMLHDEFSIPPNVYHKAG